MPAASRQRVPVFCYHCPTLAGVSPLQLRLIKELQKRMRSKKREEKEMEDIVEQVESRLSILVQ